MLWGVALIVVGVLGFGNRLCGQDQAKPEEIIVHVRKASAFLSASGEAGLEAFNAPQGEWVWKDTYIFVYNCEKGIIAAHPTSPNLIGKNMMGLKDIRGNLFFVELCRAAREPLGGWAEYWWPKPDSLEPMRKVSYMFQVPGQPYQVGAGIYESAAAIQDLRGLLR